MTEKLILENDVSQLIVLNDFLERTGEKFGMSEERIQALSLVLEEAVSNVIFYAYPEENGRQIEVTMAVKQEILEVVIRDSGLPFDPTARQQPDVGLAPDEREIGGLGIFLICRIMGRVNYRRENGENVLTMEMDLKP